MKKPLFFLFLLSFLISVSVGYASTYGIEGVEGEQGGFFIVEFKEKEFSLGDIFQPQAIIPTYVNAGSTIPFRGELAKVSDFTGFLFGVPDKLIIRIYKFDSTKPPEFVGEQVNSFTITIPESARQSLSSPTTTIVMFDATMTAPTKLGKYSYVAEPRFGNYRETSIKSDYTTFSVQQIFEICTLPSIDTTYQDITGGKLKIITQTEYSGLSCTKSVRKTYNTICNDGYVATGSGVDSKCVLGIICGNGVKESGEECDDGNIVNGDGCSNVCKNEATPPPTGCPSNQVCCEYDVIVPSPSSSVGYDKKRTTECLLPSDCKTLDWDKPNGKAVANQQCGGTTGGTTQICGDGTIQSPETCDDGNTINGDGCSNICKLEGVLPPSGGIKGIFETLLESKTRTELEKSSCHQDTDCESGADCVPFSNLPTKTQERLSEGIFNIAEEGICVIPKSDEGLGDFGNIGDKVADTLGIKGENKGMWGWIIAIFGVIIGLAILNKIFSSKK